MKYCCIFSAGEYPDTVKIPDGSFVIACDAGYDKALSLGISPDLIIGDFDSLGYQPKGDNVEKHPIEKDETDTAIAVRRAISLGYGYLIIYGALGGRLDHSLANLHIAADTSKSNVRCILVGGQEAAVAVTSGSLSLFGEIGARASVFAWGGDAHGVTLSGFKYPLNNGTLSPSVALGVSNQLADSTAKVTVSDGTLAVVFDYGVEVKL